MVTFHYYLATSLLIGINSCLGQENHIARMTTRLAEGLCNQYFEFGSSQTLQPPLKKPKVGGKNSGINGEIEWAKCDRTKNCFPFKMSPSSQAGEAGGPEYERIPRCPSEENSVPALVSIEDRSRLQPTYIFMGHGVFLDPFTVLTSASNLLPLEDLFCCMRFSMGGTNRKDAIANDTRWCYQSFHPNNVNFALIHFQNPVTFNDNIKLMPFAKKDQRFSGPCRYVSWTKSKIVGGFQGYSKELSEAYSVPILSDAECQRAGYSSNSQLCVPPLLCGTQDSGAPLICSDNGTEYIYALSSSYTPEHNEPAFCGGNVLSAFTKISQLDWEWVRKEKEAVKDEPVCKRE